MSGEGRGELCRETGQKTTLGWGAPHMLWGPGLPAVTGGDRMAPIFSDLCFPPCLPAAQQERESGAQWVQGKMKEQKRGWTERLGWTIYTIDTVYKAGNWWEPTAQRRELCGDLRGKGGQERGDWCVSVYLTHSAGQQRVTQQWSKHTPIKKKAIKYRCLLWSSSSKNRCHFSRKNQRERIIKWK